MKKEFLKELHLSDEVIEKILAENAKDVQAEQDKAEQKDREIELVTTRLKEANKTIKSYKDMDIEKIQQSATDWEKKAKELEKEKADLKNEYSLKTALEKSGTVDPDLLMKILKREDLKFQEDNIIGLEEQLSALKQDKPYLFQAEREENSKFQTHEPPANEGGNVSAIESQIASIFQ